MSSRCLVGKRDNRDYDLKKTARTTQQNCLTIIRGVEPPESHPELRRKIAPIAIV